MKARVLTGESAGLLVIDIQEAFQKSIPGLNDVVSRTEIAIRGFELLDRPVLITEQYPQGLGHTVESLKQAASTAKYFEKSKFSACGASGLTGFLKETGVEALAIAGIETHVCVNQTVEELLANGFRVHILEDAVASRSASDRKTALRKMYLGGAIPSTVEMALFELMGDSQHPNFKQVQSLVK